MKLEEYEPNVYRIWICEECCHGFVDEVLRRDVASDKWGHKCPNKNGKYTMRCESYLEPYMPEKEQEQ